MTADKDNQPYDLDDTRATLLHREMLLNLHLHIPQKLTTFDLTSLPKPVR